VASSEEYRRFAQECLLLARAAEDERARASLLHMAHVWFRLAEEHENEAEEKQSAESWHLLFASAATLLQALAISSKILRSPSVLACLAKRWHSSANSRYCADVSRYCADVSM
jgi:hypothetical protein